MSDDAVRNLTPPLTQALKLAREEADRLNHSSVGTQHVLLGLLRIGRGVAFNVLHNLGVTLENARHAVEEQAGKGPEQKIVGNKPYTARVKTIMVMAAEEAKTLGHNYVGTEHVLLAILQEGGGIAAKVLKNLGLGLEKTRIEILKELDPNIDPKALPKAIANVPPPAQQTEGNFTPRAQQVLALARKEADRLHHNFVATEHLLLGIIALGQGTAVNVLQAFSVDLDIIRRELEKQLGIGPEPTKIGHLYPPYTPRVKKCLALAAKEAKAMNHSYVGTEHILLGLLREGNGVAAMVLMSYGLEVEKTRQEILKQLDPNHAPEQAKAKLDEITATHLEKFFKSATSSSPGKTEHLLKSMRPDLTANARAGMYSHVAGRGAEVEELFKILLRLHRKNPVLVGVPGVGKTSIVHGLAKAIAENRCPIELLETRILQLDFAALAAGVIYRSGLDARLEAIFEEIARTGKIVLLIEDLPQFLKYVDEYLYPMRPEFSSGRLQAIFTAQADEFPPALAKHRWLEHLLQPVVVASTLPADTFEILKKALPKFESRYHLSYQPQALELAMKLASRHFPKGPEPETSLNILDEAGSNTFLPFSFLPQEYLELERKLKEATAEKELRIKVQDLEGAGKVRDKEVQLKQQLAAMLEQRGKEQEARNIVVDDSVIYRTVSQMTGLSQDKLMEPA